MPELSRFFGIIIRMYMEVGGPHHRPHFHAYYQDDVAVYSLDPVELIAGTLPRRQRRFVEALNNGTCAEAANARCTTTFVLHDPAAPPGLAAGPQGLKDFLAPYFAAFPDLKITVEDQIAEGDKATTRWTLRGTHRGELMGIAPTGKHATVTGITIWRVEEGKMAELWQNWDALGLLQQLGAIPQMAQAGA